MSERLALLASMVPPAEVIVDVGAHHGHLAHAVGALAVEATPACVGRRDVDWIVADGLSALRRVDVAVLAGMGARTIARLIAEGTVPSVVVAHADDDPPLLRRLLTAAGWRVDAERLAGGDRRLAELVRFVPGHEPATGLWLEHGPLLLRSDDPLLPRHLRHQHDHFARLAETIARARPDAAGPAATRAAFFADRLRERGWLA
jgi:tRNA A22 N-methylase